jgi:hypothetical protein
MTVNSAMQGGGGTVTRVNHFVEPKVSSAVQAASRPFVLPEIPSKTAQTRLQKINPNALPAMPAEPMPRVRDAVANVVKSGLPKLPPPTPLVAESSLAAIMEDFEEDIDDATLDEYFKLYLNEIAHDGYCPLTHYAAQPKTRIRIAETLGAVIIKMTPAHAIGTLSELDNSTKILMLKRNLISPFILKLLPRDWFPGSRAKLPTLPPRS